MKILENNVRPEVKDEDSDNDTNDKQATAKDVEGKEDKIGEKELNVDALEEDIADKDIVKQKKPTRHQNEIKAISNEAQSASSKFNGTKIEENESTQVKENIEDPKEDDQEVEHNKNEQGEHVGTNKIAFKVNTRGI